MHDAGPATAWALAAQPGDRLAIGGPKGSVMVADDFDFYLLIGDEFALPAIGRRVEGLRAGVPVTTIIVVDGPEDAQKFETRANWTPVWACRHGSHADDAAMLRARARSVAGATRAKAMSGSRRRPASPKPCATSCLKIVAIQKAGSRRRAIGSAVKPERRKNSIVEDIHDRIPSQLAVRAALWFAKLPPTPRLTYGLKAASSLAALANAGALLATVIVIALGSIGRF